MSPVELHGLAAGFSSKEALVEAARRLHEAGFRRLEAFSPLPVSELDEFLEDAHPGPLSWIFFVGGVVGGLGGFLMMTWSTVVDWRWNVGGRPLFSWPSYLPITFEMTVLLACLAGFVGLLIRCGLPRPYHPMFHLPEFSRATRDGFFLCVEATDPLFDADRLRGLLAGLEAEGIWDVPA